MSCVSSLRSSCDSRAMSVAIRTTGCRVLTIVRIAEVPLKCVVADAESQCGLALVATAVAEHGPRVPSRPRPQRILLLERRTEHCQIRSTDRGQIFKLDYIRRCER